MNASKHTAGARLLCLLIVLSTLLLCGCPGEVPPGGGTSSSTTGGQGGGGVAPETPPIYGEGAPLSGAGDRMADGNPSLTAPVYDEAAATAIDTRLLTMKLPANSLPAGAYRITDAANVTFSEAVDVTYDGNGAVLLMSGGLTFSACRNFTLTNLVIVGSGITLENCENVTLDNVKIVHSSDTALSVDAASTGIEVYACRLDGKTAVANASVALSLRASYIAFSETGLLDTASVGTLVRDCRFVGTGTGISTSADEANMMYNTLTLNEGGTGILMQGTAFDRTQNTIAALNAVRGAQTGVRAEYMFNSVVLLNSLISVEAHSNKNFYIIENNLGGRIVAKNNNYIIVDCNVTANDGLNHLTLAVANQNENGDALTDLTARPEVGANEALLPHIDKDQFLGMPRKTTVTDYDADQKLELQDYVMQKALTEEIIIIAPGAYYSNAGTTAGSKGWNLYNANQSNTRIYGYGVLAERQSGLGMQTRLVGVQNVTIKGVTFAYDEPSAGQAYIVGKQKVGSACYFLVKVGAGAPADFGNSSTSSTLGFQMRAHRIEDFYTFRDTGYASIASAPGGLYKMAVDGNIYNTMRVGDVLTARRSAEDGDVAMYSYSSSGLVYYDVTVYPATTGFTFKEENNHSATTYTRVAILSKSRPVITEAEYNAYKALEDTYPGVSFQMEIDEQGRYRGSLPYISGLDATHMIACAEGAKITDCHFQNMDDDGTNQGHFHARLHGLADNGDGTTTVLFKGNISPHAWSSGDRVADTYCRPIMTGHRVLIYTAEGQLVCDTEALTDQEWSDSVADTSGKGITGRGYYGETDGGKIIVYAAKVPTDSVHFDAIEGYDLSSNAPDWDKKIYVDNMSYSSAGLVFDNCLIENVRSRALLIKSGTATVKNCTFRNIGMAGVGMIFERTWGESGHTQEALIKENLFDNVGLMGWTEYGSIDHDQIFAPITVFGLGIMADAAYTLYSNITIDGNVIINNNQHTTRASNPDGGLYCVLLKGVQNVTLTNNSFGVDAGSDGYYTVWLEAAINVKIENNLYPEAPSGDWMDGIRANGTYNIYGADVEMNGIPLIPDLPLPEEE